jgi:glycine betaine/proline transport system substrate-binding protein
MARSWSRCRSGGRLFIPFLLAFSAVVFLVGLTACTGADDAAEDVDGGATSGRLAGDADGIDGEPGPGEGGQPVSEVGADRRREVRLGLTDWTGSRITLAIAEILIERRLGYPVTPAPTSEFDVLFSQLEAGELDAVLELWPSSLTAAELEYLDGGRVENLGPLGVIGQIGWYVPRYVVEARPDLGRWEGLRSSAAVAAFASDETSGRGRFVGTDPSYAQFDEDLVEALDLDFEVIYTGSEDGTRAELSSAVSRQEPILLYWWSPTAEIVEYDLVKVELPARTQACLGAAATGQPMSCDYPTDVLFKVATPGLADSDPELHRLLTELSLSTEDQLAMIHAVERRGRSIPDVALEWVTVNEETWSGWLPNTTDGE